MARHRLAALDEAFLAVESPRAHMHIGWGATFDPPAAGPAPSFEELRAHIASRMSRTPRYRQMLRRVPLGLGAPVWVDDPCFDVSRHVQRRSAHWIGELIDESMSEPLHADRPLWQIGIAERLDDGRIGVVGKAHHCMVDGLAAVELASLLLDPTPRLQEPDGKPDTWRPTPGPGRLAMLAGTALDSARDWGGLLRLPGRLARSPGQALERARRATGALADAARPADTSTPLNRSISPRRHLALLRRPIDDLLEVKHGFGVTLNDVVLAVCAGGMRTLSFVHGERPVRLKAMVPVSVRPEGSEGELGNQISFMFIDLPCEEPDPVRRLSEIHAATSERKRVHEAEGGSDLIQSLALAPSPLKRLAARFAAGPRVFNLVVSNIPGPREGLYMRGCPLVDAYPVVPIADRHTLSIGVTTVRDRACFGLYSDPGSLPDADRLATAIDRALDGLRSYVAAPESQRHPVGVG